MPARAAKSFAMNTLGEKVAAFRKSQGLTAGQLAKKVGTSRQNIENLELGRVLMPGYLCELADAMGVTTDYLLGRTSHSATAQLREPAAVYLTPPSLPAALEVLGMALAAAPAAQTSAIADNMAGWARERGADHYRPVLELLLNSPAKRQRAHT